MKAINYSESKNNLQFREKYFGKSKNRNQKIKKKKEKEIKTNFTWDRKTLVSAFAICFSKKYVSGEETGT